MRSNTPASVTETPGFAVTNSNGFDGGGFKYRTVMTSNKTIKLLIFKYHKRYSQMLLNYRSSRFVFFMILVKNFFVNIDAFLNDSYQPINEFLAVEVYQAKNENSFVANL